MSESQEWIQGIEHEGVEWSADYCIKCNICTAHCPVSNVTDKFPGPKYNGPQAQRFRDPGEPSVDWSVDYCSGCGWCTLVCPHEVKVMEMNSKARYKMYQREGIPLRNRLLGRSEMLGRIGSPVAPLANLFLHNPISRWGAEITLGIDHRAPLPRWSYQTFRKWFYGPHAAERRQANLPKPVRQVVYFHGCSSQYYEPQVAQTVVRVLEHNGCEVIVPEQHCCGLPLISNAEFEAARSYASNNARQWGEYASRDMDIVGHATSCTLTLKSDWRHILDLNDPIYDSIAEHTWDICEYLLMLYDKGELKTDFQPVSMTLPYHGPCQLRAHGIGFPAMELLEIVPGLKLVDMEQECCGIAGTYGLKREKYDIAMAVGGPLFEKIRASGTELTVCDSETCRWQIQHATGIASVHPIQLLARAYGLPDAIPSSSR